MLALQPTSALAGGTIDYSAAAYTLSSPSNAYGPWVYENLDVTLPRSGDVGLHLENRRASDRFNPSTQSQFGVDAYQAVSKTLTLYGGVFAGSGAPYVRDRFTLEADVKAGHGFVPIIGGSAGSGYGIGALHQLTIGTYYYFGDDYFSFRYTPTWSALLGQTQGYAATLALGHPGRTMHILRVGAGGENDVSLISPVNPSIVGEREIAAGFEIRHWVTASSGFHVGVDTGTLSRTGGTRIYSRFGGRIGAFVALP